MNLQAMASVDEFFKKKKIIAALLSNPATVTWLTGYAPPIQTGQNPFEGGPALGWWQENKLTLVLSDGEASAAQAHGVGTRNYVAYTIDSPASGFSNQAATIKDLLVPMGTLKGAVGVELNFLPASFMEVLKEALPLVTLVPLDDQFGMLRAVKSVEELTLLRKALSLCDFAQTETRQLIRPGVSEIEVWGELKAHLEVVAGGRLPVLADFLGGVRTAEIGGLPGNYVLAAGDPVIADIVPRWDGYWGDNAGTHFVGEPSSELQKIYKVVLDALRMGIEEIKPGIRACDLDSKMRKAIQDHGYSPYSHHTGHGVGVNYHEEPRIVPYNTSSLRQGMVIAIEPGVYVPELGGVRLEDVVLVTQSGCEVLTRHLVDD